MNVLEAAQLAILLMEKIRDAIAAGKTAIEVDDLGAQFAAVNAAIQAARGGEEPLP